HGINVQGIDFKVENLAGQLVSAGNITPKANRIRIPYINLSAGTYKLTLSGSTCSGTDSKTFIVAKDQSSVDPVPNPSVPAGKDRFELFMNTTGYGYDPTDPTGINKDWRERIEAHKTDWGYSITGVKLLVRWYDWEPTEKNYEREALRHAIQYCKDRGLKLSLYFWPWRLAGDGFIDESQYVRGQRGTVHTLERSKVMASLVSTSINQKIHDAVKEMASELAAYEGGYYMSIGTASAEEFINPSVGRYVSKYDDKGNEISYDLDGYEIGGFESMFQDGFKGFRASKGLDYQRPFIHDWGAGSALDMSTETGKDFARYISISLKNYFDNFSSAVHEGGQGKILATYTYPDAGSVQNAWHLHANFTDQAATADAMYGTDGTEIYNVDRKRLCNAVNLGLGKLSIIEYDAEDIGFGRGLPKYCEGI
ncbi:hypothetical protein, partial [Dyadobacter jejuensis]|uniref:hypothetical protein n=1 Tax=Dyadobacter jejuensis TaxID=1082580 RepID=UPI001304C3C3